MKKTLALFMATAMFAPSAFAAEITPYVGVGLVIDKAGTSAKRVKFDPAQIDPSNLASIGNAFIPNAGSDMDFDMAEKSKTINNKITLDTNLTQHTKTWKNADVENISLEELGNIEVSIPNNDGPYNPSNDYWGLFGGYQGSLASNIEKFINDEKVHQIISRYYPKFDSEDMELLFYRMKYIGCGCVAAINTIFI